MRREFKHASERISYQPPLERIKFYYTLDQSSWRAPKTSSVKTLAGIQVSLPKFKVFTFTVLRSLVKVPPTIFKSTNFKIKNKIRLC